MPPLAAAIKVLEAGAADEALLTLTTLSIAELLT